MKPTSNRLLSGLLLLFFLFYVNNEIRAAHIVGGEMTYICLGIDPDNPGNMLYEFTLTAYRDCAGGGAEFDGLTGGASTHISVYQGDGNNFDLVNLGGFDNAIRPEAPDTVTIRGGINNPCVVIPNNLCVEKGTYIFQQSLPIINETYHVVYQRCCRNNTIINIQLPAEAGSTYTISISPKAQLECNNTPVYNNFPEILICVNEPLNFDHSATDIDGDQLVYRFCTPLSGGSQNDVAPNPDNPPPFEEVIYQLPTYTTSNPLAGAPEVVIDPSTGAITGTPNFQGQHVVAICVDEFRDGELLSTVQRDFQFNITICENLVNAGLGGTISSGETYFISSCIDSTITIVNTSFDEENIDSYLWEFDIPGLTQPLSWTERDLVVTFPGPGEYFGTMTLNPDSPDCSDEANVRVVISPPIFPDFSFEYDTCMADPVFFTNQTDITMLNVESYLWDFGDGNTSDEQDPSHQYEEPGDKLVSLTITDTLGCRETYQQTVTWFPVPPIIIIEPNTSIGCPPETITFENLSTPIDTTYLINWDFGDDQFASGLNPSSTYNIPGTYTVIVDITSPIGCFISDTFPDLIFVDSLPIANFVVSPPRGVSNFDPEIEMTDISFNASFWDWKFAGGQDSSILKDPFYVFQDTGIQEIELTVTSFYGCTDTLRQIVDVVPKITFFMPNAFTPNEDGLNEIFEGVGFFRGIRNYKMGIWNRYGQLIYETTDVNTGWNGRHQNTGKLSQNGVYIYRISFTGPRGKTEQLEGYATLLK